MAAHCPQAAFFTKQTHFGHGINSLTLFLSGFWRAMSPAAAVHGRDPAVLVPSNYPGGITELTERKAVVTCAVRSGGKETARGEVIGVPMARPPRASATA